MSAAGPTRTLRTGMPLIVSARMSAATRSASSGEPASFTPPALPRPPTSTWALITTDPAPSRRNCSAAARASPAVRATAQSGTGRPWATSSDFASASWIFTRGRLRGGGAGRGGDGTATAPLRGRIGNRGRTQPRHTHRARPDGPPSPRGEMQRDLVERARRGDHDAFAELAGAAISRLDSAAWLILRDPEQAADAVQNALVRAWRDLPTLRDPGRFDAWLHRLLVRSCVDEARRLQRHRIDVELTALDAPTFADHESVIVDRDQLERGFVRLDPEMRAVIVLHHYLDLPVADVAATLGLPIGTVKSRIHRALALMRAALEADARPVGDVGLSEGGPA